MFGPLAYYSMSPDEKTVGAIKRVREAKENYVLCSLLQVQR